jgi:hypothetical protein
MRAVTGILGVVVASALVVVAAGASAAVMSADLATADGPVTSTD